MTNKLNDIKSMLEEVKKIEEFMKAKKLKNILKKHSENFKNVRKSVFVMMSAITMKQMMKKLLKCDKADVIEAVYCLKKRFNEKMNNSSLLYENYEKKLKHKRARKRHFREKIAKLKRQIIEFQKRIENSSVDVKSTFDVNSTFESVKRTMKISNSFMFNDEKIMSIIQ